MKAQRAIVALALVAGACVGSGDGPPRSAPGTSPISAATSVPTGVSESPAGHAPPRGPRIRLSTLRGRIAFDCGNDICVANVDGSDVRNLTNRPGAEFDPTWSPDGSHVAYRDSRRGINNDDEIFVVDAKGTQRRNLTKDSANDWGPAWSPDGRWIAFSSTRDGPPQLYVMRPDGSGVRRIASVEGEYPAWSPDGRGLVFMSAEPGARGLDPNYDVFRVGLDGSGLTRLTDWPGEDGWPAWSPDGKWIAFTTTHDDDGQWRGGGPYRDIYVCRPDGSDKRRILWRMYGGFPVWSPDGRSILFDGSPIARPHSGLWVVRPDGSGVRPIPLHRSAQLPDWVAPAA